MSTPRTTDQGGPVELSADRTSQSKSEVWNRAGLTLTVPPGQGSGPAQRPNHPNAEFEYARALEHANQDLRRANRELEEFAYVASHDLREPLRMINIYSELLIQECGPAVSEKAREFAGYIHSSVARMEQLIEDVLQYSQAVHEQPEVEAAPVSLRRSLDQALAVLQERLEAADAEIETQELPVVLADEIQMGIVFQNLLSNALKYADPNRPLQIRIWAERRNDSWTIHFADNGIGFEPQFAERIFGLFKRLHGRDVPGTGLGLAICRRILERCGGSIRAEGRPGAGATFVLCLKAWSHHESGFADIARRRQSG